MLVCLQARLCFALVTVLRQCTGWLEQQTVGILRNRVEARRLPTANLLVAGAAVFDPNGPIHPAVLITKALPTEAARHFPWPMVRLAVVLALLALLGGL